MTTDVSYSPAVLRSWMKAAKAESLCVISALCSASMYALSVALTLSVPC